MISITYVGYNLLGVVSGVIPNSSAILGILQYKIIILIINNENIKILTLYYYVECTLNNFKFVCNIYIKRII